ncbi:hypothetical protein [Acetobacter cibinongensis]|uniref:hypothetical protein n=1 Tax=Acetobacter cibinongensis TaxID=146475 RepID=UPI000A39BBC9|nr:hypothetical protein [Acetobacter cibinongensis]
MDLIIAPGTVTEDKADTAPTTGVPGFATDGDPQNQTPRTVFPAYVFNALLKELRSVIESAGLKLDRNDTTQLLQAIKLTVTEVAGDYIGRGRSEYDYEPLQGGVNISTGQMWFSYKDKNGDLKYAFSQAAGDYQPAGSYVKTLGDTMTGALSINTTDGQGINAIGQSGMSGGVYTSPALKTGISDTSQAYLQYELLSGQYARLGVFVRDADSLIEYYLSLNGRITTSSGKIFAWIDDIPAAPDLSQYALKSSFDVGTITGGYYEKTRLNDGSGNYLLKQHFSVLADDYSTISYPIPYLSPPVLSLTASDTSDGKSVIVNYKYGSKTNTGFVVHKSWIFGSTEGDENGAWIEVIATGVVSS